MAQVVKQRVNNEGFPKPVELIEIRAAQELTLQSRRIFNSLIENAWDRIDQNVKHRISMKMLRGKHKGAGRVKDSLRQLRTVEVQIASTIDGKASIEEMGLISWTNRHIDEESDDAVVEYEFHEKMRKIIASSGKWGRIKGHICYAFSSKYSIALYELACARVNRRAEDEVFSVEDFREFLGVKKDAYKGYPQLRQRVLEPAILEVNGLSDVNVKVTAVREGGFERGRLCGFRLECWKKTPAEWSETTSELMRPKVGRTARLKGEVVQVDTELGTLGDPPPIRYVGE